MCHATSTYVEQGSKRAFQSGQPRPDVGPPECRLPLDAGYVTCDAYFKATTPWLGLNIGLNQNKKKTNICLQNIYALNVLRLLVRCYVTKHSNNTL